MAIKSFRHKGLEKFFHSGSKAGIEAAYSKKIARILDRLDASAEANDMNFPGADFHELEGNLNEFYSVHVNGNWAIIFKFSNGDAYDTNLVDYH